MLGRCLLPSHISTLGGAFEQEEAGKEKRKEKKGRGGGFKRFR